MKLSFCLAATKNLDDGDLATLTESIEGYVKAGMSTEQAEAAAVDDLIAAVTVERKEMIGLLREQHPDLFQSDRDALPAKKKAAGIKPVRGSDALGQISARLGGLSPDLLPDLSQKVQRTSKNGKVFSVWDNPPQPGAGPLFRVGGTADMSEVARVLEEEGYITPGGENPEQQAETIVKAELAKGGSTLRVGDAAAIEDEMRARQEASMDESLPDDVFDHLGDDALAESGYADASPEVKAITEQLVADAEAAGIDVEAIQETAARGDDEATQDEYHAKLQALLASALEGSGGSAARVDAGAAEGSRGSGGEVAGGEEQGAGQTAGDAGRNEPASLTLEAQDEASLKAKTEREAKADEFDRRAQVDAEAERFGLEQQAAPEQRKDNTGDMFGGPSAEDALRAKKPGKASTGPDLFGGTVSEPDAPYTTDLFGDALPDQPRKAAPSRPEGAGVRRDVQPAGKLSDTQAPPGDYLVRSVVGSEVERMLGASRIVNAAQAAAATRYLYKSAVERLDGIVVDKNGKPLAVVGGFKGALSQTSVYPATLMGEAVRVPGAAAIWFSHNHPSGTPELSRADENLSKTLTDVFSGSGIEPKGLLAIGEGKFQHVGPDGRVSGTQTIPGAGEGMLKAPVIERQIAPNPAPDRAAITSPQQAKDAAKAAYDGAGKRPGILLLSTQHQVLAWIPLADNMRGQLRNTGGMNAIYRAVSEANAGAALIVHGGELDARLTGGGTISMNIAAALQAIDVRALDSINVVTNGSVAESGLPIASRIALSLDDKSQQDFQDTQQLARPEVIEGEVAKQDADAIAKIQREMRTKTEAFKSLELTALPRMLKPGPGASEQAQQRYAAVDLAEKLFGKRVVFFHSNTQFANGLQADYLPGMIFVNENTTRPIQAVLGHELTHSMRADHPALYNRLGDRVRGLLEDPGSYHERLNALRAQRGMAPLNFDKLREELIADIVGDNFTDPKFWRDMSKGQPTLFARVLRVVRDFFDSLLAKLKNERPYGTDRYLNDVQAARDAVVQAMSEFAQSPKTAAAAVVTAAEANLSENEKDQTQRPEFKRWFGDSKVVDASGAPLVVYHGTTSDFSEFDPGKLGASTRVPDAKKGFYFAGTGKAASEFTWKGGHQTGSVMPVYLSMKDPLIVDHLPGEWMPGKYDATIDRAKSAGYDGVIIRGATTLGTAGDYYIAFKPEQIKSAIGNSGAFDASNPDIRASENNDPFYSELSRQVETAKMASAPAQGWKDWLKGLTNKGTIKADEIAWTGIEDFLDMQQGKVSREQVMEFLNGNGVKVTETTLGGAGEMPKELKAYARDEFGNDLPATPAAWLAQAERAEGTAKQWQRNGDQRQAKRWFTLAEQMNEMAERLETDSGRVAGASKYSTYTLPGGSNYREVLLTLPEKSGDGQRLAEIEREITRPGIGITRLTQLADERRAIEDRHGGLGERPGYRSGHWDQPNVLAHIRLNDRTDADGKRVLFVEELQSDWQAAIRKQEKAISKAVDSDFEGIVERMRKAGVLEVNCD